MTPEQKAFFKYGRAFERACRRAELLRMARKRCTENPGRYGPEPLIAKVLFDRTINKARQKRAACRAWQVKERYCGNCKYSDYSEWDVPCCECSHANIVESIDRWEPRKEAS